MKLLTDIFNVSIFILEVVETIAIQTVKLFIFCTIIAITNIQK